MVEDLLMVDQIPLLDPIPMVDLNPMSAIPIVNRTIAFHAGL